MEANTQYRPVLQERAGPKVMMFVGGMALGYAIATLFAPKSGREIRSSLSGYAKNTSENVSGAMRSAVNAARDAGRSVSQRVSEALDQGKEKAKQAADTAASKAGTSARSAEEAVHERAAPGYQ